MGTIGRILWGPLLLDLNLLKGQLDENSTSDDCFASVEIDRTKCVLGVRF
jgi:hypothetical protein